MLLVHLALATTDAAAVAENEAGRVQDAIWAHAAPAHALEHVRVRAVPPGASVALFIRADSDAAAMEKARGLLANVLAASGGHAYQAVCAFPAG
ncbi:hypothetical protein [Kitasatospora sp. McL0602]|uniref:hypothetical protein n=1 Tax=Kitasatospora sp. McL0602 TaxID=3439530 RepID=UPI003F8C0FDA